MYRCLRFEYNLPSTVSLLHTHTHTHTHTHMKNTHNCTMSCSLFTAYCIWSVISAISKISTSLEPRSVENRPIRLKLQNAIEWHSKCNRLHLLLVITVPYCIVFSLPIKSREEQHCRGSPGIVTPTHTHTHTRTHTQTHYCLSFLYHTILYLVFR